MAYAYQYVPRESVRTCDGCGRHVVSVRPDPYGEGLALCDECYALTDECDGSCSDETCDVCDAALAGLVPLARC